MIPRVLVGWHVNVRCKMHAHTEETLLRCHAMRSTECGVGVGVGWGGVSVQIARSYRRNPSTLLYNTSTRAVLRVHIFCLHTCVFKPVWIYSYLT